MTSSSAASEGRGLADAIGPQEVAALVGMQSDTTGITTFDRYRWQAKLAVRAWLGVLGGSTVAVVCEHVEDLAIIETTCFRFAQLKTRDKGSWSVATICAPGHAIERLAASYTAADTAGIAGLSRFEVWLEGPPSEAKATTSFFNEPASAAEHIKKKIRAFGLNGVKLDDFLSKLTIHCHQPARPSIDAVVIRLIGALWPGLTMERAETLYEALLQVAEAAQAATQPPLTVRSAMIAARADPTDLEGLGPITNQALTEAQLRALCPVLPADTDQDLVARATAGEASLLELKLARAGASDETVRDALLARADADVVATSGRASGLSTPDAEQALDTRLLSAAGSIAALAAASGSTVRRPAEHIFHTLMSNVANTAALDVESLYGSDHRLVVGRLCSVSDECRFDWGSS